MALEKIANSSYRLSSGLYSRTLNMAHRALFAFTLIIALTFLAEPGMCQNPPVHEGPWPIENGIKRQPTRGEVHGQDITPGQANEVDKLYDELMSTYQSNHHPGIARSR